MFGLNIKMLGILELRPLNIDVHHLYVVFRGVIFVKTLSELKLMLFYATAYHAYIYRYVLSVVNYINFYVLIVYVYFWLTLSQSSCVNNTSHNFSYQVNADRHQYWIFIVIIIVFFFTMSEPFYRVLITIFFVLYNKFSFCAWIAKIIYYQISYNACVNRCKIIILY